MKLIRSFSTSLLSKAPSSQKSTSRKTRAQLLADHYDIAKLEPDSSDAPSPLLSQIQSTRQRLHYSRLIEFQLPKLASLAVNFQPPNKSTPLRLKLNDVLGEPDHPHIPKVTMTCSISDLPLKSPLSIHKFKLLAGPRWDAEHDVFKISSDSKRTKEENAKWCSDVLDRAITEANDLTESFQDIPLDTRPTLSRMARRQKRLKHNARQSLNQDKALADQFPQDWLAPSSKAALAGPARPSLPGQRPPRTFIDETEDR